MQAIFLRPFIQSSEKGFGKNLMPILSFLLYKDTSKRLTDFPQAAEQVTGGTKNGLCILMSLSGDTELKFCFDFRKNILGLGQQLKRLESMSCMLEAPNKFLAWHGLQHCEIFPWRLPLTAGYGINSPLSLPRWWWGPQHCWVWEASLYWTQAWNHQNYITRSGP